MLYALSLDVYKLKYATQQKKVTQHYKFVKYRRSKYLVVRKKSFTSIGMLVIGCCLSYILQIGSETAIKEEFRRKSYSCVYFVFVGYNSE